MKLSKTNYNYAIIEDIPDVANGIELRLKKYEQWNCVGKVREISTATKLIQLKKPELIVMDWHIKGGSTFELLEWIKNNESYTPYIIYITAYQQDEPEIPQIIINSYAVDKYIQKPIWNNLENNLYSYLKEAIKKCYKTKKVFIKDINGCLISIDPYKINTVFQFDKDRRSKKIHFVDDSSIEIKLTFSEIENFLNNYKIDFCYTTKKKELVIKDHVTQYSNGIVYLKNKTTLSIEVSTRLKKELEDWLCC